MSIVAIDGHMIGTQETGNETYIVQLAAALGDIGGHDYRLYGTHLDAAPAELRDKPHLDLRRLPDLPSPVRIAWLYPRIVRSTGAGILHMSYISPPISPCPVVLTVHDVSYKIFPQFFSPRVRLILELLAGGSMRRAARVITVSESARQDIIRFYHLHPRKVVVTPEAAGPQYRPQAPGEVARVRAALELPERYILAVGNVQPRKNLPRLVRAFREAASDDPDLQLVIAGRSTWQGSEVTATVDEMGLGERVRFLGYVDDADLPGLYAGALAFCYPSLYEGFGLPPLEAMACGTPTIASNVSSLPEVVGDGALSVDPTSVGDIAGALRRFITDEGARAEYRERGLRRAALFTWERTARLTRDVYDSVLQSRARARQARPSRAR
jgi:glycosyltransferase involved in cell wall biosynthesis